MTDLLPFLTSHAGFWFTIAELRTLLPQYGTSDRLCRELRAMEREGVVETAGGFEARKGNDSGHGSSGVRAGVFRVRVKDANG